MKPRGDANCLRSHSELTVERGLNSILSDPWAWTCVYVFAFYCEMNHYSFTGKNLPAHCRRRK